MEPVDGKGPSGQSLVELALVLPAFLMLLGTLVPILRFSAWTSWLDERLWLRQMTHESVPIQRKLEETHRTSLAPGYFMEKDLVETEEREHPGVLFQQAGLLFPGSVTTRQIVAGLPGPDQNYWTLTIPWEQELKGRFSMVPRNSIPERKVPGRTKRLAVAGMIPGTLDLLDNLGFDLFHLNLNSLPRKRQQAGIR